MRLMEIIQAKLEIYRLEQRYTKRRNRRSTFVSGATYVDGEYVYEESKWAGPKTNSTGGSGTTTASSNSKSSSKSKSSTRTHVTAMNGEIQIPSVETKRKNRLSRISIREMKWDGGIRN